MNSHRPILRKSLVGLLWLASAALLVQAMASTPYPTGLSGPSTPEERERLGIITLDPGTLIQHQRGRDLPARHINIEHLPVVMNQRLPNCGAYAPSYYYKTWQEAKERGWVRPDPAVNPERCFSPGFTFPLVVPDDGVGASIEGTMAIIRDFGIATWRDMPESPEIRDWPPDSVWKAAIPYRAQAVHSLAINNADGITALKTHLAGGDLACFAVLLYYSIYYSYPDNDFQEDNDVIYGTGNSDDIWDWHAFTIIGYDDNREYSVGGETRRGAFVAVNSWGPWGAYLEEAGSTGFVWFGYDFIRDGGGGSVRGVDTSVSIMTDRIGYTPTTYGMVGVSHERRVDLTVTIAAGQSGAFNWTSFDLLPHGSPSFGYTGVITVDLTDYTTGYDPFIWLSVSDMDWSGVGGMFPDAWLTPATGTISYFAVETADGQMRVARDTPVATVDWPPGQHPNPTPLIGIRLFEPANPDPLAARFPFGYRAAWGDFDRDGDADLLACGQGTDRERIVALYENQGGALVELDIGLPQADVTPSWVDFDCDGWPDIALAGTPTGVWRNLGNGTFERMPLNLPDLNSGRCLWGDVDHDGFPDLLLAGTAPVTFSRRLQLYRNVGGRNLEITGPVRSPDSASAALFVDFTGDGELDMFFISGGYAKVYAGDGQFNFTDVFGDFYSIYAPGPEAAAAVDFNNDGAIDLVLSPVYIGAFPHGVHRTVVYRNNGNGQFTVMDDSLPGYSYTGLEVGDVDNDGLPDLLISGGRIAADQTVTWNGVNSLYINRGADGFVNSGLPLLSVLSGNLRLYDLDRDGDLDLAGRGVQVNRAAELRVNQPPAMPTGLAVWPGATRDGGVILSWLAASDAETDSGGLRYQVRCGTVPGGEDLLSAHHEVRHTPGIPVVRTDGGRVEVRLRRLPEAQIAYWSVRTLDAQGQASPWTADRKFMDGANLPDPPQLPFRLGGRFTLDGVPLETAGAADLIVEARRPDGRAFVPPVWTRGLNASGCYTLDVPVSDSGADQTPTARFLLRAFLGNQQLDLIRPQSARLFTPEAGTFKRFDLAAGSGPRLLATIPDDDAVQVSVNTTLTLQFDRAIIAGTGELRIFEATGTPVAHYAAASQAVTVDNSIAVLTLAAPLAGGREYFVLCDVDAFTDAAAGTGFAGISVPSRWNFQTANRSYEYQALALMGDSVPDTTGAGAGSFARLMDVAIGVGGNIHVMDQFERQEEGEGGIVYLFFQTRIQTFSPEGEFISQRISEDGSGNGQFNQPHALAVGPDGAIYVADTYNDRIQKLDAAGEFVAAWGSFGTGEGQFSRPFDIAVSDNGIICVVDLFNRRVQLFTENGEFLFTVGEPGTGEGQFSYPEYIGVDAAGFIYVTDRAASDPSTPWLPPANDYRRIQKFDATGRFVCAFGEQGWGSGRIGRFSGLAVSPAGAIYVADGDQWCVSLFSATGEFLNRLQLPAGDMWDFANYGRLDVDPQELVVMLDYNGFNRFYARRFAFFREEPARETILHLGAGWNMLSSPFIPASNLAAHIFQINGDSLAVWKWWSAVQEYLLAETVNPGLGYWVYGLQNGMVTVKGHPPASRTTTLLRGWNLIGVISPMNLPLDQPFLVPPAWTWSTALNRYEAVYPGAPLLPGHGYWVYVADTCDFLLAE